MTTWTRASEGHLPLSASGNHSLAFSPAVASHANTIFLMWQFVTGTYPIGQLMWGMMGQDGVVIPRLVNNGAVQITAAPALVDLNGTLHAILADSGQQLFHYQLYLEPTIAAWAKRVAVGAAPATMASKMGPAVLALRDQRILCVAETLNSKGVSTGLCWSIWATDEEGWSASVPLVVPELEGMRIQLNKKPTLVYLGHKIYLIYVIGDDRNNAFGRLVFDPTSNSWATAATRLNDSSPISGCHALALETHQMGFLTFAEKDTTSLGAVIVRQFDAANNTIGWKERESKFPTLHTANPPALAAMRGTIYCFFTTTVGSLDYLWRPIEAPSENWMSKLPVLQRQLPISELNIPGTHDSAATMDHVWVRRPWTETQTLSIGAQLQMGIRFLDLRLALDTNAELWMVHASMDLHLRFQDVVDQIDHFLATGPNETVIVNIKNDREKSSNVTQFETSLKAVIDTKNQLWFIESKVPTLEECKGKIVLWKRFPSLVIGGVDMSKFPVWPSMVSGTASMLLAQDHWNLMIAGALKPLVETKWLSVMSLLTIAAQDVQPGKIYMHFLSATGLVWGDARFIAMGRWDKIDNGGEKPRYSHIDGINQRLLNYFVSLIETGGIKLVRRLGIIIMDYPQIPNTDLVSAIISSNFK